MTEQKNVYWLEQWIWGSKILGLVVPVTCCRLISIQRPWWSQSQCCKLKFNCSSKDWLKCFPCLWQVLIFSGQISGFLVDFDIQKHSPFISWQCEERWFKPHFSPPFQILSGTRNIYAQLKQKNKEWTSLFKNFCFSLPALSLAIFFVTTHSEWLSCELQVEESQN